MNLSALWESIQGSSLGVYIAESTWAFPTIETIHVIAIVTVIGSIAIMDMRLLGITSRDNAVTAVSRDTLPLTWIAFAFAVMTGSLLFVSKATSYMANPWFLSKMVLIACAGINMMILHSTGWKSVRSWDTNTPVPRNVKISAALSLAFWFTVIFCGRVIGFTLGIYE